MSARVDAAYADAIAPHAPSLIVCDEGWQDATPAPWRRWLARRTDGAVLGTVAWVVLAFALGLFRPALLDVVFASPLFTNAAIAGVLVYAAAIPLLVLLTGLTGSSPGKWLFGVRVTRRDGRPIGVLACLRRELHVWAAGMAFALPLFSLGTMAFSYQRLKDRGVARWDEGEDWVVTHRPGGVVQALLAGVGVLILVAVTVLGVLAG